MKTAKGHIVVVDDDLNIRTLLEDFLVTQGYTIAAYSNAPAALKAFQEENLDTDLVLSDFQMDQMNGMEFLKALHHDRPEIPLILMTAFASVDTAIEAMKNGAYHYIVKPFKLGELGAVVERAIQHRNLTRDNKVLRDEVKKTWGMGAIIGKSKAMKSVFDLIERVSHSTSNVLINGESGSGKEMVARAIHDSGPRKRMPFIAINCTAIPETLLESELFGHAKGSFTGAVGKKIGLIQEANGGTLFLDEIGDMSPNLQAKLLRVLQERKIRPVGDNSFIDVDVRVIAATHKDLKAAIKEGQFREDLFYRLSVIPLTLPSLRERSEDIPLLAEHFLRKFTATMDETNPIKVRGFSKDAIAKLVKLPWPGNVRELENVVERAVVLSRSNIIEESDIPDAEPLEGGNAFSTLTHDLPTLAQLEERYMQLILERTAGRKDKAAQILGINRRTLYRKEREFGWVTEELEPETV